MAKQASKPKKAKLELSSADVKEFEKIICDMGSDNHEAIAELNRPRPLSELSPLPRHSTGVLSWDIALGGLGFAEKLQYELSALESAGKTQRVLRLIARLICRTKRPGLLCDLEGTIDPEWATAQVLDEARQALGDEDVDWVADKFLIDQPLTSEVSRMEAMLAIKNHYCAVAMDSVGAIEPDDVYQGMETGNVSSRKGAQAGFMSQTCRSLTNANVRYRSPTMTFWINQLRTGGNMMMGRTFLETMGGRALKFFASARSRMKVIEFNQETGDRKIEIKIIKNKIGPPFRSCTIWVRPDGSVNHDEDLYQCLTATGLLVGKAGYYDLMGERLDVRGIEEVTNLIVGAPETVKKKLRKAVIDAVNSDAVSLAPPSDYAAGDE